MDNLEIREAFNELINEVWEDAFKEKADVIHTLDKKEFNRSSLTLTTEKNTETNHWEVKLNHSLLGIYENKEKAEEFYSLILNVYNQGLLEGLEKGALLGTEGFPDALDLQMIIQKD